MYNGVSVIRVVISHPSQEGATGMCVNSSPIMSMRAAVSTRPLELLALIKHSPRLENPRFVPGFIGEVVVLTTDPFRPFFRSFMKMIKNYNACFYLLLIEQKHACTSKLLQALNMVLLQLYTQCYRSASTSYTDN